MCRYTCKQALCFYRTYSPNAAIHNREFHGKEHVLQGAGNQTYITRRDPETGKLKCPLCDDPQHNRFQLTILKRIVKRKVHQAGTGDEDPLATNDEGGVEAGIGSDEQEEATDINDYEGETVGTGDQQQEDTAEEQQEDIAEDPEIDISVPSSCDGQEREEAALVLQQIGFHVESRYNLSICNRCEQSIKPTAARSHYSAKHNTGRSKMPTRTSIENAFHTLGAFHIKPIPSGPIPHIEGISITDGYRCMLNGCGNKCFAKYRTWQNHALAFHSTAANKSHTVEVDVQIVQSSTVEHQVVSVTRTQYEKSNVFKLVEQYATPFQLQSFPETVDCLDIRELAPTLAQSRWKVLLEGVKFNDLHQSTIVSKADVAKLKECLKTYVDKVLKTLKYTNTLLLQYVRSDEMQVP